MKVWPYVNVSEHVLCRWMALGTLPFRITTLVQPQATFVEAILLDKSSECVLLVEVLAGKGRVESLTHGVVEWWCVVVAV